MKGLLIKDMKLLLGQKRFYIMVLAIGILFMFSNGPSMGISYTTTILAIFTLSTISYDEFDNGMSYLMVLPIDKKTYVKEKYVFGGLLSIAAYVLSAIPAVLITKIKPSGSDIMEVLATGMVTIVISCLILALTLPLQIKFGADKGKIAIMAGMGIIGFLIAGIGSVIKLGEGEIKEILIFLTGDGEKILLLGIVLLTGIVSIASYFISVRFIEKREY